MCPSRQKGKPEQTEGLWTEVGIQQQLPSLQSPLLPERPHLGREKMKEHKGPGWELLVLRGKRGFQHGESRQWRGSRAEHQEGVL